MAKAPAVATSDTKTEVDSAPLLDLNEGSIKKLIARAKRRGVITMDELNEALPQDQMTTDQIEDIMSAISEMGVNIVESDEDAVDPDEKEVDEVDETESMGAERPAIEVEDAYAQMLGPSFIEQQKPFEVELCVAEVGIEAGVTFRDWCEELGRKGMKVDGKPIESSEKLVSQIRARAGQVLHLDLSTG